MRNFITIVLFLFLSKNYSQSNIEVKDYDGNLYKTEDLGGILITTSNLNVTHFNNGDKIFEVNSIKTLNEANNNSIPAYCHFKFDKSKATLYNWYAIIDKRGLLPKGYVIPNLELLKELNNNLKQNPKNNIFSTSFEGIADPTSPRLFYEFDKSYFWASEDCSDSVLNTARYFDTSFSNQCIKKNNFLPVKFVKLSDVNTSNTTNEYKLSKNILLGHNGLVSAVKFSKSGKYIASGEGGKDVITNSIKIWDVSTGNCIQTINDAANGGISSIDFSPDESRIIAGSNDKSIKIWNVLDGRLVKQFKNLHSSYIRSVKYNNLGDRIVSSECYDGTIIIWNANTGESLYKIKVSNTEISEAVFSPDGKYIVCGNYDNNIGEKKIFVYNTSTGSLLKSINNNDDYVQSINFSSDGKKIITSYYKVNVIDFISGNLLSSAKSLSPFGGAVKCGESDNLIEKTFNTLEIRDISKNKILQSINVESQLIYSFDVTSDGKLAAIGTEEKSVKLFKLEANKIKTYPTVGVSDFGINKITFSYTGNPANKKFSDGYIEKQKILGTIGYACNKFIEQVDTTNKIIYKKELKRLCVLVDKKLMIPKINIIKIFFSDVKQASIEYKTSADIYESLIEQNYFKPSENSWGNPFTTLPINIQKYETDEEVETGKRESARIQQEFESKTKPEGSNRKYCVYTNKGKYEISLLDDKTFVGYYKLYDNLNKLIKTVQGRWTIRDEGVYGSAYRLTFDFTGANSNLSSMKFTCQYDGSGQLQALIDNQDRTWNSCR